MVYCTHRNNTVPFALGIVQFMLAALHAYKYVHMCMRMHICIYALSCGMQLWLHTHPYSHSRYELASRRQLLFSGWLVQGIINMNRNGNLANFFPYVCNGKKIKELFASTLDGIPISVKVCLL